MDQSKAIIYQSREEKVCARDLVCLHINIFGGNVILHAGPENTLQVLMQWPNKNNKAYPTLKIQDGVAYLQDAGVTSFFGQHGKYVLEIFIPQNLFVHVKMFGGTVILDKLSGGLDIRVKAGEISRICISQKAKFQVGAGTIDVAGFIGDVDARVIAGDLHIAMVNIAPTSNIQLRCALGSIQMQVPKNILLDAGYAKKGPVPNKIAAKIATAMLLGDVCVRE